MNDIQLYKHIKEYCFEIHKDGKCFVYPHNYEEFVKGLDIRDSEYGINAFICSGGDLAFDIDELEYFANDFDALKEEVLKEAVM